MKTCLRAYLFFIAVSFLFFTSIAFAQTVTITPIESGRLRPIPAGDVQAVPSLVAYPRQPVQQFPLGPPFIVTLDGFEPLSSAQTGKNTFVVCGTILSGSRPAIVRITRNTDGTITKVTQELQGLPGATAQGIAEDMTSDGQTFVGYTNSPNVIPFGVEAVWWDASGVPTSFGFGQFGVYDTYAYAISDNGIAAGTYGGAASFMTMPSGQSELPPLASGLAVAVSADAKVIGGWVQNNYGPTYWKWSDADNVYVMHQAEIPPNSPGFAGIVSISPNAHWMVGFYGNATTPLIATLWNENGQILQTFGPGRINAVANNVLVINSTESEPGRALIYKASMTEPVPLVEYFDSVGLQYQPQGIAQFVEVDRIRRVEAGNTDALLLVGLAGDLGGHGYPFFAYAPLTEVMSERVCISRNCGPRGSKLRNNKKSKQTRRKQKR